MAGKGVTKKAAEVDGAEPIKAGRKTTKKSSACAAKKESVQEIKTRAQRKALYDAERSRLAACLDIFPEKKRDLAERLIDDIAFMGVTMRECRETIQRDGIIDTYQNGENQSGTKKSAAVEVYDKLANSRLRCIKQLSDMLPEVKSDADDPGAMLRAFIGQGMVEDG